MSLTEPVTPTRLPIRRVQAVINAASGGVGPACAEQMARLLAAFGLDSQVRMVEPDHLAHALHGALAEDPDVLVVLGGDGSIGMAASLCGPQRPLLVPLPGGSMNMLPKALYGPRPWPEALAAALSEGVARPVSGGEAGGQRFYCAAILGTPALWQPAREAARHARLVTALQKAQFAFRRAFTRRLRFQVEGGRKRKAVALSLICPLISRDMKGQACLEAATLNVSGLMQLLRLAIQNLFGDWRRDPSVAAEPCVTGHAWARKSIPCLIDGEFHHLGRAAEIRFLPHAFTALAPPDVETPAP